MEAPAVDCGLHGINAASASLAQSPAAIRSHLGPVCADLVESFKKKSIAYQTKEALRADVIYTANFKRGASADVKSLVIQSLKASFGGSIQSNSNSSVQGNGLYYGLLLVKIE